MEKKAIKLDSKLAEFLKDGDQNRPVFTHATVFRMQRNYDALINYDPRCELNSSENTITYEKLRKIIKEVEDNQKANSSENKLNSEEM